MSMDRGKYGEVVQAGMDVLDKKVPGWECRIDPDTLDLASCQRCILGQIYGDYVDGRRTLELTDTVHHGFTLSALVGGQRKREWEFLTKTWLRVLRKRLSTKIDKITKRGV